MTPATTLATLEQHQPTRWTFPHPFSAHRLRTICVQGFRPEMMTEHILTAFFSVFGTVKTTRMTPRGIRPTFGFVEFSNHYDAALAISEVNCQVCLGDVWRVTWAVGSQARSAIKEHHVFVGDLDARVTSEELYDTFSHIKSISSCRVIVDFKTNQSKGYGFISFVNGQDAQAAINTMHGYELKGRKIRTNWATRDSNNLTFDEVYNEVSAANTTVFCAGIREGLNQKLVKRTFGVFGKIQMAKVLEDKGVAFIKFLEKVSATNAIVTLHKSTYQGQTVRCCWAREDKWASAEDLECQCSNPAVGTSRPSSALGVAAAPSPLNPIQELADVVRGAPLFYLPGPKGQTRPFDLPETKQLVNGYYRLF